jgi:hypothetical protein
LLPSITFAPKPPCDVYQPYTQPTLQEALNSFFLEFYHIKFILLWLPDSGPPAGLAHHLLIIKLQNGLSVSLINNLTGLEKGKQSHRNQIKGDES